MEELERFIELVNQAKEKGILFLNGDGWINQYGCSEHKRTFVFNQKAGNGKYLFTVFYEKIRGYDSSIKVSYREYGIENKNIETIKFTGKTKKWIENIFMKKSTINRYNGDKICWTIA